MVQFIKKNKLKGRNEPSKADVKISSTRTNNKKPAVMIKISTKLVKLSFKSDYIAVGYDENNANRLYFAPSDDPIFGFSLCCVEKEKWYQMQIAKPKERIPNIENFNGSYSLYYDEQEGAYYIDSEKRFTM